MYPNTFTLADEGIQVSVDGQHFDIGNFFTLEGTGFKKDAVNFNKGWLGIFMENAEGKGILIQEITQGSPAAEAGLRVGDIVTKINNVSTLGKDGLNLIQFKKTMEAIGAGGMPELTALRDGAEMVFEPRLFAKLLKNVPEPITCFISKKNSELTQEDKNTPPLSTPSQGGNGGAKNLFLNEKTTASSCAKQTGTSFIGFARKNERYKDMLGSILQRIGEEAYAREGFQSNEEANPFRLSLVNYLLLHPLDTPRIGQAIYDRYFDNDICAQIGFAAELLDAKLKLLNKKQNATPSSPPSQGGDEGVVDKSPKISPDTEQLPKTETTYSLQGQLQGVIDSLVACVSSVQGAFHDVSQDDAEFLYQNAHKIWLPDEKIAPQDLSRLLVLSQKVNLARLFEAAVTLLEKTDVLQKAHFDGTKTPVSLFNIPESLRSENHQEGTEIPQNYAGDILFIQDTSIGKIVVGGTGTSYYYADAAVIIDLGGDDYYFNNAGSSGKDIPVSICIDFSGNDVYHAKNPFSQGTGRFGIGLLIDCEGNDTYISQDFSQGSGLFGVGLLADNDGNDFYSGHVANQGVGFFGAGLLSDLCGNDRYFSRQFAQGVGFTRGVGALLDADGNDFYLTGGEYPDFRDPGKSFQSMSQGMGMGIRPEGAIVGASGGIGILIDQKGNDQYHGDYFSQGNGYYFSLGFLCDNDGNDTYYAGRYAQGAGIHSAIGLLKDSAGDDTYASSFGVSQGCGHDTGIGFLVDECGNDTYRSETTSQGAGLEKGIGVLADFCGNDRYQAQGNSQGFSSPSKTEEISGIGILIDNQGDHDIFHDTIAENLLLYRTNGGLVLNK
ncbi:MAG: PDZ domain-containing protein [Planctomycetia bacterium]|nr:PDZ domain-containing protein [Planctomycetia bacterium]